MNGRPTGVTVIALLIIIGGLLGIFFGLPAVLRGGASSSIVAILIGGLIISVAQLVVGIGLWTLQKWAWTLAVIVLGVRIAFDLVAFIAGGGVLGINLIIPAVLLWYLFRPNVRQPFGR